VRPSPTYVGDRDPQSPSAASTVAEVIGPTEDGEVEVVVSVPAVASVELHAESHRAEASATVTTIDERIAMHE
jgi:hypothetical protein